MKKQKSLGQVAWNTYIKGTVYSSWEEQSPRIQAVYERIANAVAREVQKRLREKGK